MNLFQLLPGLFEELNRVPKGRLSLFDPFSHGGAELRAVAGQAGFEPATTGFGVRRSVQLELLTPRSPLQFDLSMQGVGPAKRTEFLKGQLVRSPLSVLCGRIVLPLTLVTRKTNELPHGLSPGSPLLDY